MDTVIRLMCEADLHSVARLEQDTFSDPWSMESLREVLEQDRYCKLVLCGIPESACEDSHVCVLGYIYGATVIDEGELYRIAVAPIARGLGFGQKLMECFLREMEEKGAERIFLEVRAGNSTAISLYEKNGFIYIDKRKGYYRNPKEDAWIMLREK